MKILCAISGIEYNCEHFPAVLSSRETTHPIFHLKQKKLISFISKWTAGELTAIDSYLLFLSLLNSTELVDFRVPVRIHELTNSIVATNMESLVSVVSQINLVKNPALAIPSFAVTSDTSSLANITYWIESWQDALDEFKSAYKATTTLNNIRNREQILERLIKSSTRDIASYSGIIADWAELAGTFPKFQITDNLGAKVTLADYWKSIIRKCTKSESIFSIPEADISELIEHCEQNIPHGSIYAANLMKLLRDGLSRRNGFLGADFAKPEFIILDAETSVEHANKLNMINNAPVEKPVESDYPTKFAWLKAKLSYDMAQEYNRGLEKLKELELANDSTAHIKRKDDINIINTSEGIL